MSVMPNPLPRARGLVRVRAEADPKATIEALNKAFEAFKAAQDEKIAEVKKGFDDVVKTEQVNRINDEVGKLQAAIDEINRALAAAKVGGAKPETPAAAEHRKAFDRWFRRGVDNNLRDLEIKASLKSDSDPDGGYTVPEQMEGAIDRVLGAVSAIRSIASVMSISAPVYKKLVNVGGATSGWVGEREARSETDTPVLKALEFPAMELYANPATTQVLLDDSTISIEQWLANEVAIEFAEEEGSAFYSGDGVNKPRGLASYPMVADASYAWGKVGFVASGVASTLSDSTHSGLDALVNLVYALKQGYRSNARFLMNRATQGAIRKLASLGNEKLPLWQPSMQVGQPATLLGYPITDDDNVDDIGAGNFPIWFGDFRRAYLVVDRQGVRVLRDPYTNKPYVHFYTTKRVGGGIQNFEAIKALKIST